MKTLGQNRLGSLYEAIGQEPGLSRMLHSFYHRMKDDLLIGFFFAGKDVDAIAEKQKTFLMRAFGATPSYTGKAPAQAHVELAPILAGHFDRRLRILESVLKEAGLTDNQIEMWVTFENSFRPGIETEERSGKPSR